eukprot:15446925-Alexandrium_andersonii.AAC.1
MCACLRALLASPPFGPGPEVCVVGARAIGVRAIARDRLLVLDLHWVCLSPGGALPFPRSLSFAQLRLLWGRLL